MKRPLLLAALTVGFIAICGCGSSKPEVPSWFKSNSGSTKDGKTTTKSTADSGLRDLQDRLQKLQHKIKALDDAILSVDKRKTEIVKSLHENGVRSSEDLNKPTVKDEDTVKRLVNSLLKNRQEHDKYVQMRKEFKSLLEEGKDAQDTLQRQINLTKAGISDKDVKDINIAIKTIEEGLEAKDPKNPIADIKADAVIDRALKSGGF